MKNLMFLVGVAFVVIMSWLAGNDLSSRCTTTGATFGLSIGVGYIFRSFYSLYHFYD